VSGKQPSPWQDVAWSHDQVGEAVRALARAARLAPKALDVPRLVPPRGPLGSWLDDAIVRSAAWLDVEAEPVGAALADLDALVAGLAPALVLLGEDTLVAVLRTTRRHAVLLAPDGTVVTRPADALREAMLPQELRACDPVVDAMLERAGIAERRRERARRVALAERHAGARVGGVWILRRPPHAPFVAQLRAAGTLRDVALLALVHAAEMALFATSWGVLGAGALSGHFDRGWLAAWALLLLSMVPVRAAAARLEGRIAVGSGALLKRRLLAGALALDPDDVRADGAGRMLGRVVETEAVEQLAVDAGGTILFVTVDLLTAAVVLALGATPSLEVGLLVVFAAVAVLLARAVHRRRGVWTDARLALTHDMVERLVGHRTRIAQEPRETWHDEEDQGVRRALEASTRLDRITVGLAAALPRAWLVASLAAPLVALVGGARDSAAVAVTLGGALIAFRAFRRAASGANVLSGLVLAWSRVRTLFDAARAAQPAPSPRLVVGRRDRARGADEALVEARDVSFQYARRDAPALRGVSLRIEPGDHVLLLGDSGSGKSTLGALIAGLRRPKAGLLLLDGLDAGTLGLQAWRARVASAPQFHENHVLGGPFAFNLLMGRAWPPQPGDLELAEEICRELHLGPLLDRMPGGMLQTVGEVGWQLSHGERSRMFLARALLQDVDLVVLDESFAALDPETVARCVDAARKRAKALLVIAHP
jgi:ATP-binding cassette subfamily B protein